MSGVWRRSYGRPTKAPPDERGGNRHGRPNTTAPHPDSTLLGRSSSLRATAGLVHEERLPPLGLSARYVIRQETSAEAQRNGRHAPVPATRRKPRVQRGFLEAHIRDRLPRARGSARRLSLVTRPCGAINDP